MERAHSLIIETKISLISPPWHEGKEGSGISEFTWILREFYPRDAINFYFRNVTSATDHHLRSPLSLSLSLSTSPGILSLFLSLTHSLTHSLTLSSILCLSSRSLFSMLLVLRPKARENRGFVAYATCQASQTLDSTTLSCLFVRKYNNGYVERG